jgi:hypothetical protein
MKTYAGNHPDLESEWAQLSYEIKDEGFDWAVYEKEQEHSQEWRYYKIAAVGRVPMKANYWFAKNLVTGQIGYSRDIAMMRATRSGLHAKVERALEDRAKKLNN